jgi:hypothetical protein
VDHPLTAVRAKLPAAAFRGKIVSAIADNQVVVVCGETGCGKTTQVRACVRVHACMCVRVLSLALALSLSLSLSLCLSLLRCLLACSLPSLDRTLALLGLFISLQLTPV